MTPPAVTTRKPLHHSACRNNVTRTYLTSSRLHSLRSLAARWNMPTELAVDLAALSLYDIIIYAGGYSPAASAARLTCLATCLHSDKCVSLTQSRHWRHRVQVLTRLCCLADDSTSMKYADKGERIDDLRLILERVAEVRFSNLLEQRAWRMPQTVLDATVLLLMHMAAPEAVL